MSLPAESEAMLRLGIVLGASSFALLAAWLVAARAPRLVVGLLAAGAAAGAASLAPLPAPLQLALGSVATAALCAWLLRSPGRIDRLLQAHRAALETVGDGLAVTDAKGRLLGVSGALAKALPTERGSDGLPKRLQSLVGDPERRQALLKAGGRSYRVWLTEPAPKDGTRALLLRDVTARRRDAEALAQLKSYDSLTGLANRRLFVRRLSETLASAGESGHAVALFQIDVDHLGDLNQDRGHEVGDRLLRELGQRLQQSLRAQDLHAFGIRGAAPVIARLGGDEFGLLISGIPDQETAESLAQRVLQLASVSLALGPQKVTMTASAGYAMFPQDAGDAERLLKHAEQAVRAAKQGGRGRFAHFEAHLGEQSDRAEQIEAGLRAALESGELALHYQPVVGLEDSRVVGLEALLRWTSADLGVVGPAEFIPIAERSDLMGAIGGWSVNEVCRQIHGWRKAGFDPLPVSLNVSRGELGSRDLEREVSQALEDHGVPAELLQVELTESLMLEPGDEILATLRTLRSSGVGIVLDDFGTGRAALATLNQAPVDVLKMDRALVQGVHDEASDAGVAAGVVAMAHSLGLSVVAEGVDSEEQLAPLAEMGCDRAQGFLYAPAVPASQAERFLPRGGAPAPALEPTEEARPGPSATEAAADPDADLPMLAQDFGDDLGRVLLVDDSAGSLATVSLRIARLGVDTHYASFVDEAHLFVNQEGAALRVLVAPPDIDLEQANEVVTAMGEQLGWRPPFLIVGEEPDAAQRAAIREAGVSSVLWAPFDDEELRFLVKSALSMPEGGARDEKRVPLNQMATLRVDNRRESALLSSLSVRGAFFETANPPPVGTRLRIDFELAPDHFRLFGEVRYRQLEEASEGEERSGGVGVTFYGVEEDAEHALRKAVEERAARYLP